MKYINLIDYINKPELIQHEDGRLPVAVIHCPNASPSNRVVVVFSCGTAECYTETGRRFCTNSRRFILRPKPKRVVKGYRKAVLSSDGDIRVEVAYRPSRERFEHEWSHCTLLGDWQEISYEVADEKTNTQTSLLQRCSRGISAG